MAILFSEFYASQNLNIESKLKVLRLLVSEIAAILENGRHNRPRRNLTWHYSSIYLIWYNVHVCQVSCFYHKMHDFLLICWATTVINRHLPVFGTIDTDKGWDSQVGGKDEEKEEGREGGHNVM